MIQKYLKRKQKLDYRENNSLYSIMFQLKIVINVGKSLENWTLYDRQIMGKLKKVSGGLLKFLTHEQL
jgi:hypothetical protein